MPDKPRQGSPCNHCGWCCQMELCVLARSVWGDDTPGPCPALRMSEAGASSCGMVEDPAAYLPLPVTDHRASKLSAAAKHVIGAGLGCDAQADGEPFNVAFDHALDSHYKRNRPRLLKAAAAWGIFVVRLGGPPDA